MLIKLRELGFFEMQLKYTTGIRTGDINLHISKSSKISNNLSEMCNNDIGVDGRKCNRAKPRTDTA